MKLAERSGVVVGVMGWPDADNSDCWQRDDSAVNREGSNAAFDKRHEAIASVIGATVIAAASLEKSLLGAVILREGGVASLTPKQITIFESETGGQLLGRLRGKGMDAPLVDRADDLIKRRNKLIHGLFEDVDVARAMTHGDGFDELRDGIEQLGMECHALSQELQLDHKRAVEDGFGMSLSEIATAFMKVNPSVIEDPAQREELERVRSFIELTDWPNPPLYEPRRAAQPEHDQDPSDHRGRTVPG